VRAVLSQLQERNELAASLSEKQLIKLLEAARHMERRPAADAVRGRPSRWPRAEVRKVAAQMHSILQRETRGRVSLSSFVSQYLRLLRYPSDVTKALEDGDINLQEAAYLARLMPARLGLTAGGARQLRHDVLKAHRLMSGSQNSLRARVKALLGETTEELVAKRRSGRQKADALIRRDPFDARHLFYEEAQRLIETMSEVEPDDLNRETLDVFLKQLDRLQNLLQRLIKRRGAKSAARAGR
jgi:hypothetical protein